MEWITSTIKRLFLTAVSRDYSIPRAWELLFGRTRVSGCIQDRLNFDQFALEEGHNELFVSLRVNSTLVIKWDITSLLLSVQST